MNLFSLKPQGHVNNRLKVTLSHKHFFLSRIASSRLPAGCTGQSALALHCISVPAGQRACFTAQLQNPFFFSFLIFFELTCFDFFHRFVEKSGVKKFQFLQFVQFSRVNFRNHSPGNECCSSEQ
jgi:hypothetical protein